MRSSIVATRETNPRGNREVEEPKMSNNIKKNLMLSFRNIRCLKKKKKSGHKCPGYINEEFSGGEMGG